MKKLFTLMSALLLWQTMAVAQNYLHISSGDSVKIVRFAELDSVTVRDRVFYGYDWEYLTMGTYTLSLVFGGDVYAPVYKRQISSDGTKWQFLLENFIYEGIGLVVDYDSSIGRCHVQPQATGYNHDAYGMIMIADCATYTGNEENYVSTFNEQTGLFELYVVYYVDAGVFGYGYEYLQLDMTAEAPTRARDLKEAKLEEPNKIPLQTLRRASGIRLNTKKQTEGKRTGKASVIQLQPCTTREIVK